MRKIRVIGYLLLVVLGVLAALAMREQDSSSLKNKDARASYLKGGDFTLSSDSGELSLSSLKGRPVILYFGYTYCPDACPVGLAVIRDALQSDPAFSDLKVLFVTVDPARDTASRLAEYVTFFHPNIIPLRGSEDDIRAVANDYGTYFMSGAQEGGTYAVDHTAYFYLIDAEGELVRVLDHSTNPEQLAESLKMLL